ncbi:MAG: winged helix-turn-helix transcriptional regulator [Actinobacteria bacterium]|nr:MAG: winged helix-turn-helix transcriptional regulator [Actinomycetota bacterium]
MSVEVCSTVAGVVRGKVAPQICSSAALLADEARVEMLLAISESGALAATHLAERASVSAPTASAHLAKLSEGGLVTWERSGRLRLYRISGPGVVLALEALAALRKGPASPRTRSADARPRADELARSCYDHLAGRLGVGLTEALLRGRVISKRAWSHRATKHGGYGVTRKGVEFLRGMGVDPRALRSPSRSFAHPCLDRTERRPHLAGALGAAMARRLAELGWVQRLPRTRAVRITPAGKAGLRARFGLEL